MQTYRVVAVPCGAWWAIDVVGLPGGHTNAGRFDDVEPVARRLIAALLEVDPGSFDVEVVLDLAARDPGVPQQSRGPQPGEGRNRDLRPHRAAGGAKHPGSPEGSG